MSRLVVPSILFLAILSSAALGQSEQAGFPARGLIDLDEGTLEAWVQFAFDPSEKHKSYKARGSIALLDFSSPVFPRDEMSLSVYTLDFSRQHQMNTRAKIRFGINFEDREIRHPMSPWFKPGLKPASWHHIAVCWSGKRMWAYLDGKRAGDHHVDRRFDRPLNNTDMFYLGLHPQRRYYATMLVIDELRISRMARPADQIGFAGQLQPDANTLLLLTFDQHNDRIVPAHAATQEALKPQLVPTYMAIIAGKYGNGLALSAKASAFISERPSNE